MMDNNNSSEAFNTGKRTRTSIACTRCHHKKIRCDGRRPSCSRCLAADKLCGYPTCRRARNTQPPTDDPYIDRLSHLEDCIRRIEDDMDSLKSLAEVNQQPFCMTKIEQDVQESRSIVAKLRLLGEQQIARSKRRANNNNKKKQRTVKQQQRQQEQVPLPPPPPTVSSEDPVPSTSFTPDPTCDPQLFYYCYYYDYDYYQTTDQLMFMDNTMTIPEQQQQQQQQQYMESWLFPAF